ALGRFGDGPRMRVAARFVVALLAGLCLLAGCGGANNKSRIEGKRKFVLTRGKAAHGQLRDRLLGFGADGGVTPEGARVWATSEKDAPKPQRWQYKLLAGDEADFYNLPPDSTDRCGLFGGARGPTRVTIRIEVLTGEKYERCEMTLTDADGRILRLTLVRP